MIYFSSLVTRGLLHQRANRWTTSPPIHQPTVHHVLPGTVCSDAVSRGGLCLHPTCQRVCAGRTGWCVTLRGATNLHTDFSLFPFFLSVCLSLSLSLFLSIYIYIYISLSVCLCLLSLPLSTFLTHPLHPTFIQTKRSLSPSNPPPVNSIKLAKLVPSTSKPTNNSHISKELREAFMQLFTSFLDGNVI